MVVGASCVEVGGGGSQTVHFRVDGGFDAVEGIERRSDLLALCVPGEIDLGQVTAANLGWWGVDPLAVLGLEGPVAVVCNDAEAAALGEAVLRGLVPGRPLVYLGLGTGVGGASVDGAGRVSGNLFGHTPGHGDRRCSCGAQGCLETVAAGWALPRRLAEHHVRAVGGALARAVRDERAAADGVVVVGGGLARRNPGVVDALALALPGRDVEPSAAPAGLKSAAAFGLLHLATSTVEARPG